LPASLANLIITSSVPCWSFLVPLNRAFSQRTSSNEWFRKIQSSAF
jgi:hypothetical protein